MASSQYWGEIYCEEDNEVFNSALTLEDLTKPRQLDTKGPLLFQPSSRHHSPSNEPLPEKWFQIDPITLHTISLIQYAKKARQAIQIMNQHQTDNIPEHRRKIPVLPPFPVYTGLPLKHVPRGPLNFILPDLDNDFACGVGESPPEIDTATNRNLLRRSVAAICAHLSFEGSPESVLETLTDVANEFYLQFMKHMSSAADARSIHKQPTFPDIIEQVFHELGFGSVTTLHDFYHCRVLNYHRRMTETCQALVAEYNNLKLPIAAQPPVSKTHDSVAERETFNVIRIKEEPNGDKFFPMLNASNDNVFDAEHFLHLDGIKNYEITVERETAGGDVTTDLVSTCCHSPNAENLERQVDVLDDDSMDAATPSGQSVKQHALPAPSARSSLKKREGRRCILASDRLPLAGPSKVKKRKV